MGRRCSPSLVSSLRIRACTSIGRAASMPRKTPGTRWRHCAEVAARLMTVPLHPRTQARLREFGLLAALESSRDCWSPIRRLPRFSSLDGQARLVFTDSGGYGKRPPHWASSLIRENRASITVTARISSSASIRSGRAGRRRHAGRARSDGRIPALWDGHAAERILNILRRRLPQRHRLDLRRNSGCLTCACLWKKVDTDGRMIVLELNELTPSLMQRFMAEGKLPNSRVLPSG